MLGIIVPSENKKDIRSIEQTMADIQAKKRLKTMHTGQTNIELIGPTSTTTNIVPDDKVK